MIARLARVAVCALLPAVVLAPAGAQTAAPSPTAAPTPISFTAHAHATVTVVTENGTFGGTAQLGMAQRTNLTRIDVLSLTSDSVPIPPIAVTAVIDRTANTVTVWNDTTKLYRVQPFIPRPAATATPRASATPRPSPRASATPRPPQRGTSPFANLDVLSVTLKLTGHTTTAGLPTTGLAFDLMVQRKGDKGPAHVTATTQVADEFTAFPVTIDVSLEPGATPFSAKLGYAVDDLTRGIPPATTFTVPAGYKEAPSLLGVIFPGRTPGGRTAVPSPSPSPRR